MTNVTLQPFFQQPFLILIDKPVGMSSNQCLQKVKRLLGAKKAGHGGSLDPLASGLLPICLNRATKFSQYLLNADKSYVVAARLGIKTTTGDADGEVLSHCSVPELTENQWLALLQTFQGEQQQIPPMYSALKVKGKPLYHLARQGVTIERAARSVIIRTLELVDFTQFGFTLSVTCSKGTYIRQLVEDIGEKLGCGAHVVQLRRVAVGQFDAKQMVDIEQLSQANVQNALLQLPGVLTLEQAFASLPKVAIHSDPKQPFHTGLVLSLATAQPNGMVALYRDEQFLGIGDCQGNNCLVQCVV